MNQPYLDEGNLYRPQSLFTYNCARARKALKMTIFKIVSKFVLFLSTDKDASLEIHSNK